MNLQAEKHRPIHAWKYMQINSMSEIHIHAKDAKNTLSNEYWVKNLKYSFVCWFHDLCSKIINRGKAGISLWCQVLFFCWSEKTVHERKRSFWSPSFHLSCCREGRREGIYLWRQHNHHERLQGTFQEAAAALCWGVLFESHKFSITRTHLVSPVLHLGEHKTQWLLHNNTQQMSTWRKVLTAVGTSVM